MISTSMDITSMLISATIMTIVGYLTDALFRINAKKIVSDLTIIFLFAPLIIFLITAPLGDVEALTSFVASYTNTLVNALPGMLIGDIVGTSFAEMTKGFKGL